MPKTAEAVVIGGGVMGASILFSLVSRGVDGPELLERDTLESGSTGRSSGAVRMHYSTAVNADLAWQSLRVFQDWDDLVGAGDPAFVKTGYMVFAPPESIDGLEYNIAVQQSVGVDTSIVTREEARELGPYFHFGEDEAFAYEPESGHADPSGTGLAYATRAQELGAQVVLESPALDVEIRGGKVIAVTTANERYDTPIAVVATGP